ncbi:hypothetical protein [Dactylosporangium sp. NPDC051541]|uniref:hypothetical protein n=1 Tax=Dactylosporangium sp. NPDC051541 TaxID=3363977 RepID=UPI0037AB0DC0
MTTVAWSALALTAVIATAALALGLRLAARVRELRDSGRGGPPRPSPGTPVLRFATADTTGAALDETALAGPDVLVALLLEGCGPCRAQLPAIRRLMADAPPGEPRPIAVVVGAPAGRAEYVRALGPVARVVEQDDAGAGLAAALGVGAFPCLVVAGGGVVRQVADAPGDLVPGAVR